jgi:hypothetical protein
MAKRVIMPLLTFALTLAVPALAGQPEREKKKEEEPKVKQAIEDSKKACGCAPDIKVDWDSYKSASDMGSISSAAESVAEALKGLCTDAENKKAICKGLKSYSIGIHFKAGSDFEEKSKAVTCGTDGSSFCSSGQFRAIFEKW